MNNSCPITIGGEGRQGRQDMISTWHSLTFVMLIAASLNVDLTDLKPSSTLTV